MRKLILTLLIWVGLFCQGQDKSPSFYITPMPGAFAHNDYAHEEPLTEALSLGFANIEADIILIDGTLYVAHEKKEICKEKTLQALYLDPLEKIITKNNGYVFKDKLAINLFIDIKSDADSTYAVLKKILQKYKKMISSYKDNVKNEQAINVVISGNRPKETMKNETIRYASWDGRISDIGSDISLELMPVISDSWPKYFSWKGGDHIPINQKNQLRKFVRQIHAENRIVRFWGTDVEPYSDQISLWNELLAADVDIINTDKLEDLQKFLASKNTK